MPLLARPRPLRLFEGAATVFLIGSLLTFIVSSWHWPLVGDAPLMHYVVFLMEHGRAPYRDIIDFNLPGTLAIEAGVMQFFGPGALAWRLYDFLLLATIGVAMAAICCPRRFPALLAAITFALIHGRDGLIELGQRDLLMAALLLAAYALLFAALRSGERGRERYGFILPAGILLGSACTVKPDAALLAPPLLALVAAKLRSEQRSCGAPLLLASAGFLAPLLAAAVFLVREHAFGAFLELMLHLAPYHASIWRLTTLTLLLRSVSSVLLPFFCL